MDQSKQARSATILRQARRMGEHQFDPEQNLIFFDSGKRHVRYTGHIVVQQSLEYAIALLQDVTGDERQRHADIARAEAIVNRVLDFQVRDPRHFRYGNFLWMTHWDQPHDPNAAAFVTPPLVHLYRNHAGALHSATLARMEEAFSLLGTSLVSREVPYEYTNIKLLTTACQFLLAPLLPESQLENLARFQWLHTVGFTAQFGFAEYNSPTYLPVFIEALELMWEHGPRDLREQFERMLEYAFFEFAVRYHAPTGYLAGAMSRAYPTDTESGQGLGGLIAFLQWGVPHHIARLNEVRWALGNYIAPEAIRRLAFEKSLPLQMKADIWNRVPIRRTDYLASNYSLGSQDGYYGNQEVPLFATARHEETTTARRSLWLESTAPGLASLASQQQGGEVAGIYFYDQQMVRDNTLIRSRNGDTPLGLRWRLGDREFLQDIQIDGNPWDGNDLPLATQFTLTATAGKARLGLKIELDEAATAPAGEDLARLLWQEDELVLALGIASTAAEYVEQGTTAGMRFYLRLDDASEVDPKTMQALLAAVNLKSAEASTPLSQEGVCVETQSTTLHAAVPEPFYLHNSAITQIRPNDLLLWLQGKDEAGRKKLFGEYL